MINERFGRLVVVEAAGSNASGRAMWRCRCDCGNAVEVLGKSLRAGHTKSCGCLQSDVTVSRNLRHGAAGSKEHKAWKHIKDRCLNPRCKAFKNYGGRGIAIAPEWVTDFGAFMAHIGPAPDKSLTVERIQNNLGYVPGNVRWATRREQTRNTRRNVVVTFAGNRMVLADACALAGIDYRTASARVRNGCQPASNIKLTH